MYAVRILSIEILLFFQNPLDGHALWLGRHGHTEDLFMLGTGVKRNKLLKNYRIFFSFVFIYGN